MARTKAEYVPWLPKAKPSDLFPYAYKMHLVHSIEELNQILSSYDGSIISFDTETTGLNSETDFIVGYSFCFDRVNAYYVPVSHYNGGLGKESLDIIYNTMSNSKVVPMYNMRFDTRMMEYCDFIDEYKSICDTYTGVELENEKLKLSQKAYHRFNMTKVNTIDVQAMVYLVDTNIKFPSLKASEEWYLGWRGASFEQTVSKAENPEAIKLDKER